MTKWNRFILRAVSVGMAGSMVLTTPVWAAGPSVGTAGVSALMKNSDTTKDTQAAAGAGVAAVMGGSGTKKETEKETLAVGGVAAVSSFSEENANARKVMANESVKYEKTEEEVQEQVALANEIDTKAAEENEPSPYDNIAISQVNNYVNIRTSASEEGDVVGKIYNNAAATIVDTVDAEDGTWYQIESGSVTGYIKSDYFVTGKAAEEIAYQVGNVKATVGTETLRLRSQATTDSSTLTLLSEDEKYDVVTQENGFVELKLDDDVCGYVDSNYVTMSVDFDKAVSIEEEQEALEAQRRIEESIAEEEAAARAQEEADDEDGQEAEPAENDDADEQDEQVENNDADETKAKKKETTEEKVEETEKKKETTEEETEKKKETTEEETEKKKETTEEEIEKKKETTEEETEKKKETTEEETEEETEKKKETTEEETEEETKKKKETTEEDDDDDEEVASSSGVREDIVDYALSFVGNVPYKYGGTSLKTGVDCSGFVQQVFKHFGYSLPRTSGSQGSSGKSVSSSKKKPGDIVYYGGHVAIYIGGGEVVHASNKKTGIKVSKWNYRSVKSIRNVID